MWQGRKATIRTIKLLQERLSHQSGEVETARKNLGRPGFSRSYLRRMESNCRATKKTLDYYYKRLKK